MKKFAPIIAIALFAMAFTSCKKDYTCSCTLAGNTPYSYTLTKAKNQMLRLGVIHGTQL